jgi:hypothetical protein
MRRLHALCAGLLFAASGAVQAEFYQWVDEHGYLHISTIPRAGVRPDGSLRPEFDPRSVANQYPAMLQALREQGEALRLRAEAEAAKAAAAEAARRTADARPAPARDDSTMSLLDLIELEKRGGRAPEPVPQAASH